MLFNKVGEILYLNSSAAKYFSEINDDREPNSWASKYDLYDTDGRRLKTSDMPLFRVLNGESFEDYRIVRQYNGMEAVISSNGTPFIEDDEIQGGIVIFRDITQIYHYKQILKEQKNFYMKILDVIPASIHVKDMQGNYFFLNENLKNIYYSLNLKEDIETYIRKQVDKYRDHDQKVIESGKMMEFVENYFLGEDEHTFHVTRFPLYEDGKIVYLAGISFDVTAEIKSRKETEELKLRSANSSKLASLGSLAGEIGHEINNPLSIIKSITYILKDLIADGEFDPEYFTDKVNDIENTVDRMADIVKSLKNLSRKSGVIAQCEFPIKDIIDEVLTLSQMRMTSQGIRLVIDLTHPSLNLTMTGDRIQLSEVLLNLITNAADALEGNQNPEIKISFGEKSGNCAIRVRDNGTGVPDSIKDKIFEAFYTTKEEGKGTGLGLSIAKKIMLAHKGDLVLETTKPTTFAIILPVKC